MHRTLSMSSPENNARRSDRSQEDQDNLERSTKKTKRLPETMETADMEGVEGEEMGNDEMTETEKEGDHERMAAGKGFSYKCVLTSSEEEITARKTEIDLVSDDEKEDNDMEDEPDCPAITLTKEEKVRLRKPWKQSLIIKVMGNKVGYAYLLRRLNTIWHPKSRMELITLENDYFLVKFNSVCDYEFAKYGGPWMIMEHYLIVKEWRPNFDPNTDTTEKVLVWVRLPDLPIEYYDQSFLFTVGRKIGEPIRIDSATSLISRGKFARMCIEVDITKPLLAKFWLRRRIRRIEYEGIHLVCFKCGVYGHSHDSCSKKDNAEEENVREAAATAGGNQQSDGKGIEGKNQEDIRPQMIRPEITDSFGPWMIAKRNTRRQDQKHNRKEGNKKGANQQANNVQEERKGGESSIGGSRFATLEEETQEEIQEEQLVENGNIITGLVSGEKDVVHEKSKNNKQKGKRPAVQISEKQVRNSSNINMSKKNGLNDSEKEVRAAQNPNIHPRNKAGAAEEHVVVHGEKNGAKITTITVCNQEEDQGVRDIPDLTMQEHHNDPPFMEHGIDLNFTVNDNSLYVDGYVHGEEMCDGSGQCMDC